MRFDIRQAKTQWRTLVQKAGEYSTELGIYLGRSYPVDMDDSGVLVLEFEPGADKAWALLQSPEKLQALEAFLTAETDNIIGVQMRKMQTMIEEEDTYDVGELDEIEEAEDVEEMGDVEKMGEVTEGVKSAMEIKEAPPDSYDDLLQDAGIAVVVNEFRGNIVAVHGKQKKK